MRVFARLYIPACLRVCMCPQPINVYRYFPHEKEPTSLDLCSFPGCIIWKLYSMIKTPVPSLPPRVKYGEHSHSISVIDADIIQVIGKLRTAPGRSWRDRNNTARSVLKSPSPRASRTPEALASGGNSCNLSPPVFIKRHMFGLQMIYIVKSRTYVALYRLRCKGSRPFGRKS